MARSANSPRRGPAPGRAPYLGLAAFGDSDDDAELFFGRSTERDLVIANLRSARVTVLYGPSGVGKSSLLHAGVAHRLRTMEQPSPVIVLDDWDANPTAVLTDAVSAATADSMTPPARSLPLAEALEQLRARRAGALLVILDQFEEYLRLHAAPSVNEFDDALAALLTTPDLLARVLIAVRDDRLADLDRFEDRIPGLFGNVLRLDPLTREAALEAILLPVERYNEHLGAAGAGGAVTLEQGLAERVLDELGGRRSELPALHDAARRPDAAIEPAFLSLTMRRVWDADVGAGSTVLRLSTLASLGGAARIFATHLETSMEGLPIAEQNLAADLLHFMVTPSGATQRYSALDLAAYAGRSEPAVEALAEKLSRAPARILRAVAAPTDDTRQVQYELAHQVLARPALEWQSQHRTARLERRSRRLLLSLVAVSAIAVALAAYVIRPAPLNRLELDTVTARFAVRGAQRPDRDIVLVTIDDRALSRLLSSPLGPRATVARALDRIAAAAPRAIACDIIFTGARTLRGDAALIAAVHRDGSRLALATDSLLAPDLNSNSAMDQTELFGARKQLFTDQTVPAVGWAGFPGNPNDRSAVVSTLEKNYPPPSVGGGMMDTLAVVTARVAGLSLRALSALPPTTWIAFRGGAGTFPTVPFNDVLAGRPAALSRLRDRIVVLGITARAVGDVHDTSAPGRSTMSGPELQTEAISTALRGFPLRDPGLGVDVALIVLLGLVPLAAGLRLTPAQCALCVLAAAALFCVGAELAFGAGRVISVVFPLASLAVSAAGVLIVLFLLRRNGATRRSSPAR